MGGKGKGILKFVAGPSFGTRRDHVIVFGPGHLKRVLRGYFRYYHEARTHLGLEKECPVARPMEPPRLGPIESEAMVGGLHHRYFRRAA